MKLSDLKASVIYEITADEVEARLQVVTPGPMPTCILSGHVSDLLADSDGPITIQLVGWLKWGDSAWSKQGYQPFSLDTQPECGWLVGARSGGENAMVMLACSPDIKPLDVS